MPAGGGSAHCHADPGYILHISGMCKGVLPFLLPNSRWFGPSKFESIPVIIISFSSLTVLYGYDIATNIVLAQCIDLISF